MEDKGIISSTIESITKAFNQFIKTVKKNGIIYTIISIILFVLMWQLIVNPIRFDVIIEKQLERHYQQQQAIENRQKNEMIERRYKANDVIGNLMNKILHKYHCNRVLLLEKHNSLSNLGNVDFLYLSASIELIDIDNEQVQYISDDLQRQVVYNLLGAEINTSLRHNDYLYFPHLQTNKRNECRLLSKLAEQGDNEVLMIPFEQRDRVLLLMVVTGDSLNVSDITEYVNEHRQKIMDLLIYD